MCGFPYVSRKPRPDADCSAHIVERDNRALILPPEKKHWLYTWQMGFWAPFSRLMHINEMLTCSSFSQEQAMKVKKDEKRRKKLRRDL